MKTITFLVLFFPYFLQGQKETETTARINDIVVYTSSAEISYEKELLLHKGKSTIVFTDLTPFIVENSVNVSVSDIKVNILTVAEFINYTKENRRVNQQLSGLQDSIKRMKKQLGLIAIRQEVLEAEKSLLFKGESIGGLSTRGVAVSEIEKASAFFSKRYYELSKELFTLEETESELNVLVKNYSEQFKQSVTVTVKTTSEIKVTVNSPDERKVKFNFKFLTNKAGWAPVYDFKCNGATQPLEFVFRANVFNASGVAWQEVNLKLSTADPIRGFSLPSLNDKSSATTQVDNVKFKQIEVVNAITEYSIAHQYSIPSDAKPYLVDVNAFTIPASYNYLLIPKLDPFAFLIAKIPAWNKYNLIPGVTNVYNSGMYMGKTFLDTYTENDTLSLYLGKDKNIQSVRTEKNTRHHRFPGTFIIDENKTEISIKSNAKEVLPVEVLDQVPVFDKDDKEKISLSGIGAAFYDKEEGLLNWHYRLQPGETVNISYGYEIKAPKEHHGRGRHTYKRKFRTISCPSF